MTYEIGSQWKDDIHLYHKYRKEKDFIGINKLPLAARLMARVKKDENGCWIWQGSKMNKGYGMIAHNRKMLTTHRVSYEIHKGKIPKGSLVCHSCDVPSCVNPDHLWLGSYSDNRVDCLNKGRGNLERCKTSGKYIACIKVKFTEGEGLDATEKETV